MTCIVGFIDEDKVYIGGDSASVDSTTIVIRKDAKVFKVKDFVIGATTSWRMIQLLKYKLNPPPIGEDRGIFDYMCTDFIDTVIKLFKENGFERVGGTRDDLGGQFLVGYKNRLFRVCDDYHVEETIFPFNSVGCGADFAMASMLTNNELSPLEKLKEALRVSEILSTGVSAPFIILNT